MKIPDLSALNFFRLQRSTVFCFLLAAVFSASSAFAEAEETMLYFYSSETNINNFKSLKTEFDAYLSAFGPYKFQPFSDREAFEKHVKGRGDCLIFLSSWHYSKIYKDYSLQPLLTGVRKGKKYQKRILVANSKHKDVDAIKNGAVASSSNIPYTRSILEGMFNDKSAADSVRILTVPKDIDALMSVGFEMSKSALITEHALGNLEMIDPVLHKKMKTLAKGRESLLLVVAAPSNFAGDVGKMTQIIQDMPKKAGGMDTIKMFDLDGWEAPGPTDKSKLED